MVSDYDNDPIPDSIEAINFKVLRASEGGCGCRVCRGNTRSDDTHTYHRIEPPRPESPLAIDCHDMNHIYYRPTRINWGNANNWTQNVITPPIHYMDITFNIDMGTPEGTTNDH
jgi:hypothetical protein